MKLQLERMWLANDPCRDGTAMQVSVYYVNPLLVFDTYVYESFSDETARRVGYKINEICTLKYWICFSILEGDQINLLFYVFLFSFHWLWCIIQSFLASIVFLFFLWTYQILHTFLKLVKVKQKPKKQLFQGTSQWITKLQINIMWSIQHNWLCQPLRNQNNSLPIFNNQAEKKKSTLVRGIHISVSFRFTNHTFN